ncbi:hypothetical protein TNCV_4616461 [Trichonephila clavipes]|nr:hypothetical protein TNCV_4616461 [Trichonephila clavipes]
MALPNDNGMFNIRLKELYEKKGEMWKHLPNKIQKLGQEKEKKSFKKLDEAKIEIKMAPHKPRKSAPMEYSTNEEDMIVYDIEDELEFNPDYVKKGGKIYYKGEREKS